MKNGQQFQKWLFSDANRDGRLMPSLLFRCFSLFLPHLRTLAQEKKSQNCLRFGTGFPLANHCRSREKKTILANRFAHAISVHYWDFEHAHVYWIWLGGSASYVLILNSLVTLATYWVPDLPNFKDISGQIGAAFHFDICEWCLICLIQQAYKYVSSSLWSWLIFAPLKSLTY